MMNFLGHQNIDLEQLGKQIQNTPLQINAVGSYTRGKGLHT